MDIFAADIQKAHLWLKELVQVGEFRDESLAYSVLRVVLHTLRDRLIPNAAGHLGSQLPTIISGMYYSGWNPDKTPTDERTIEEFFQKMMPQLARLEVDGKKSIGAVCQFLEEKLNESQIQHICDVLPQDLKPLFLKVKTI